MTTIEGDDHGGGSSASEGPHPTAGPGRLPATSRRSRRSARPGGPSTAARPAGGRRPRARPAGPASSSTRRRALASAAGSPTGASRASTPSVATLRWPSRSEATSAQPEAIASSRTMPNDSPRTDGEQYTVQPRMRAARSSSLIRPSHSMRGSWPKRAAQLRALRAVAAHPDAGRRRAGRPARRAAPRGPCGARGGRGRRWSAPRSGAARAVGEAIDLDAVEEQLVVAAEVPLGEGHRVGRHRAAHGRARLAIALAGPTRGSGTAALSPAAWNVPTSGASPNSSAVMRGARGDRLVQVERRRSPRRGGPGSCGAAPTGPGASGATEPLAAVGHAAAEGRDAGVGRRAVARARARAPRGPAPAGPGPGPAPGPARRRGWSASTGRPDRCASRRRLYVGPVRRPVGLEQVPLLRGRAGSAPRGRGRGPG